MAYNPDQHKQVLIDKKQSLPKLLELMDIDKRGQQAELDYLIAEAHKRATRKAKI